MNFVQPTAAEQANGAKAVVSLEVTEADKNSDDEATSMIALTIGWGYTFKSEKTGEWIASGMVLADAPEAVAAEDENEDEDEDEDEVENDTPVVPEGGEG